MRGTNEPRSRPCRPINVTCWRATGKLLKKNYHLGYAHRGEREKGQGEGQGEGQGRERGQRRVPSSIQEKMPQKPKMPTKLRQLRDATPGGSAALCCASREIKQSWREKCVVRAYMHVYVCVCVCVIVNKLQRDRRHTQISMHCTLKRKRNHKQKKGETKNEIGRKQKLTLCCIFRGIFPPFPP